MSKASGIAQGSQRNAQGLFLLCVLHQHDLADLILFYDSMGDENYGHRHQGLSQIREREEGAAVPAEQSLWV